MVEDVYLDYGFAIFNPSRHDIRASHPTIRAETKSEPACCVSCYCENDFIVIKCPLE